MSSDEQPSVLVLAGNIVEKRFSGPGGSETRYGTRLFRPRAKVYLSSLRGSWGILDPNQQDARLQVVGQHRLSREWIQCWVRAAYVTNWRFQVLYQPGALNRLREADWPGFNLSEEDFCLGDDRSSPTIIREFLEAVRPSPVEWRLGAAGWGRIRFPESSALQATLRPDGWVRCPACGKAFATYDPQRWSDLRHTTCGQRIELIGGGGVAGAQAADATKPDQV